VDRTVHRPAGLSRRGGRLLSALVVAVAVLLVVRAFAIEPFRIPTASMAPTLRSGDHVLVSKLAYLRHGPRRGDLVVFKRPRSDEIMLKRVVGLEGDTVEIADGILRVNGVAERHPAADPRLIDSVYFGPKRVAGGVFVLGDNRAESMDSTDFGSVPRGRIIGRVLLRIWPPKRVGDP
jgi:signal peptidase I